MSVKFFRRSGAFSTTSLQSTTVKELAMAASLTIEEERGTFVRSLHPHNGYYAGDFSRMDVGGITHHGSARVTVQGESS